jgi:hypothetical protein
MVGWSCCALQEAWIVGIVGAEILVATLKALNFYK